MPKKLTLDVLSATAQKKGGQCISTSYIRNQLPLRWRSAEGQGRQYYERMYFQSDADFNWQRQKDQEKRDLCAKNSVILIEVPWTTENLNEFAIQEARKLGIA